VENITDIVNEFKRLTEPERLELLEQLFAGPGDKGELNWRAHLVTALRENDLYPYQKEKPPRAHPSS